MESAMPFKVESLVSKAFRVFGVESFGCMAGLGFGFVVAGPSCSCAVNALLSPFSPGVVAAQA